MHPATKGGVGKLELFGSGGKHETIEVEESRWLYSFEVDAAGDAIREGRQEFAAPGMNWADSTGNLRVLDQWRAAIGLEYTVEKAAFRTRTISGDTLKPGNGVPKRSIPGLATSASVVALGFEFFPNFAAASLTLDSFYEAGGNLFDTAYIYAGGKTEEIFGDLAHQPQCSAQGARPHRQRCPFAALLSGCDWQAIVPVA